eukprot:scaffold67307_cov48-Phaeocystis_antarctica.AAC.5
MGCAASNESQPDPGSVECVDTKAQKASSRERAEPMPAAEKAAAEKAAAQKVVADAMKAAA